MSCRPSAAARTVSLFDGRTDLERKKWEGRDGSAGEEKRRRLTVKTDPWEAYPAPPGIADTWSRRGKVVRRIPGKRGMADRFEFGGHEYETLTAAIAAAERAR